MNKAAANNQKALLLARKMRDLPALLQALVNFNSIYVQTGNAPALLTNNTEGIMLAKQLKDIRARARLQLGLGSAYGQLGDNKRAVESYDDALRLYRVLEDGVGIASVLNNISAIYDNMGNEEKSREYLQKALRATRKIKDDEGTALVLANLGQAERLDGNFDKAFEYLHESLEILKSLAPKSSIFHVFALTEMAQLHFDKGDNALASEYLKQAQKLSRTHGFKKSLFLGLMLGAKIHIRQNNLTEAAQLLKKAETLADQSGMKLEKTELFSLRATLAEKKGDYQQALQDQKTYIKRTLAEMEEADVRQTLAVQALFDAKEKQREIDQLKQQHELQQLQFQEQQSNQQLLTLGIFVVATLAGILLFLVHAYRKSKHTIAKQNQALSKAIAEVQQLAKQDPLTKLLNRRGFLEILEYELLRQQRENQPISIILADIDHFKKINDIYGHDCGDRVLQNVARFLRRSIRKQDSISRWGGEEFLVMMPNTGVHQAKVLIERIRMGLSKKQHECGKKHIEVTMTFGISTCVPGDTPEQCIARADAALYIGKAEGRNRAVVAKRQNPAPPTIEL